MVGGRRSRERARSHDVHGECLVEGSSGAKREKSKARDGKTRLRSCPFDAAFELGEASYSRDVVVRIVARPHTPLSDALGQLSRLLHVLAH